MWIKRRARCALVRSGMRPWARRRGTQSVTSKMFHTMKTISITVDEAILNRLDRLAARVGQDRSSLIREAMKDYACKKERQGAEAHERDIFTKNRSRLEKQLRALVAEQLTT